MGCLSAGIYRNMLDRSLLTVKATIAQTLKSKVMHKHLDTHTVLATRHEALQQSGVMSLIHTHTHTHPHATGVEGNQAQGFLQSDRCGDRPSSQAETLNGFFNRRPGVTFIEAREQSVSTSTHTHTSILSEGKKIYFFYKETIIAEQFLQILARDLHTKHAHSRKNQTERGRQKEAR